MSRLASKKLKDNAQGNYIVPVSFTYLELKEVLAALRHEKKAQDLIKKDPAKSAKEHELAGHRSVQLAFALRGLYEAYVYIKQATNARQEGRYQKAITEVRS